MGSKLLQFLACYITWSLTTVFSVFTELQRKPVISLIPHFLCILSAQEAKSSGQPFPWHCLQVLWTSSIRLHRIPRQVSNTHTHTSRQGQIWVVVHRARIGSRLCLKLARASFFRCPLINQISHLPFYFVASSVFPSLVPVHASVSTVAEMFPISYTTTDAGRKREREVE